jgi:hypothetical protein
LSESQRNALSKAALGRGIDLGHLFGQLNEAGGLAALEKGLSKSITLTNDQAKALDDLKDRGSSQIMLFVAGVNP